MDLLNTANVFEKLAAIEEACHRVLLGSTFGVPSTPARDVGAKPFRELPPKQGLGSPTGRARMLHDLASIELQAMELGLRTLIEFPEAPRAFREELAAVTISEGEHLKLCLDGLGTLNHAWGDWPVHTSLWSAVDAGDDLIDRVLIVHRYLEGSGLDAGDRLMIRLSGMPERDAAYFAVERIHREEIGHVDFGSRWFRELCRERGIDAGTTFEDRMNALRRRLPYRTEPLAHEPRLRAGFTSEELDCLERWRARR